MPYDLYSKDGADASFAPKNGVLDGGTAAAQLYDIRIRHDDSAGWAAEDPILSRGEEGIDTDTGTRKVGDGILAWSALPASGGGGGGGSSAHGDLTGRSVAGQHPISAITDLQATLDGKATTAQGAKADTAVQPPALAAHEADTTNVHGITDSATLVHTSDARLADARAPLPHTSASVTDFTEAAQDAIAALLAGTSGVSLSYNDTANTLTITGPGASGLDAEAVRDAIGVALLGTGLISVAVNDAADTITISTTATANATDAALRDRSTHTGTQAAGTVTGLATVATTGVYADLTSRPTLGTAAATAAADYATAAQGSLAGTASQPGHTHAGADIASGTVAYARLPVGTTAGTVAAGDDSRIVGALQASTAQAINAQTGTSYTLVAGDAGKVLTLSNAAAITLNAPGSVFTTGQRVDVVVINTGMATVVGTSGATANGTPSLVSRAQWSAFTILWTSATACVVIGDLA